MSTLTSQANPGGRVCDWLRSNTVAGGCEPQKQKTVRSGFYKGRVKKYKDVEPKIDGAEYLSDIWDAFTAGKFQKEFNVWGHGTAYYRDGTAQMHEIFANLFTVHNSKQSIEYIKKNFPNSLKAFEDRLNEFK